MTEMNTIITGIAVEAAREAGIREEELWAVNVVSEESGLCEMILETEWNRVICYADTETGEILGLMGEGKSSDEMLPAPGYIAVKTSSGRKAA